MVFSEVLLNWYVQHKRDLPWRKTVDPYRILVSEIMLQQTQVSRVIVKYGEFLGLFPTIFDLAKASKADVINAWSGMGYNRRALLLHQFAQEVVKKYDGIVPQDPEQLIELPGIGPYAAGSIAAFAYNKPTPAIDVNVRRIYLRFFEGKDQGLPMGKKEERELYELVKSTIPDGRSRDLHNALMDFGSLVCTRDAPKCGECPLKSNCTFFPLYSLDKEKALFVMEKKREKGMIEQGRHIPNRIFRGRIVEFVRRNEGREITVDELGKIVKKDYVSGEEDWLLGLVKKLEREGIISLKKKDDLILLSLA